MLHINTQSFCCWSLADYWSLLKSQKLNILCLQINRLWRESKNFREIRKGLLQSQKEKSWGCDFGGQAKAKTSGNPFCSLGRLTPCVDSFSSVGVILYKVVFPPVTSIIITTVSHRQIHVKRMGIFTSPWILKSCQKLF